MDRKSAKVASEPGEERDTSSIEGAVIGIWILARTGRRDSPTRERKVVHPPERKDQENNAPELAGEYGRTDQETDGGYAGLGELLCPRRCS